MSVERELEKLSREELIALVKKMGEQIRNYEEYLQELESKENQALGSMDDAIYYGDTAVISEFFKERYPELKSQLDKNEYMALSNIAFRASLVKSQVLKNLHDFILKHKRGHKGFTMDMAVKFARGISGSVGEEEERVGWTERIKRRLRGG